MQCAQNLLRYDDNDVTVGSYSELWLWMVRSLEKTKLFISSLMACCHVQFICLVSFVSIDESCFIQSDALEDTMWLWHWQVHVDEERFERYSKLGDMADFVTTDGGSTQLHACRQSVSIQYTCTIVNHIHTLYSIDCPHTMYWMYFNVLFVGSDCSV